MFSSRASLLVKKQNQPQIHTALAKEGKDLGIILNWIPELKTKKPT